MTNKRKLSGFVLTALSSGSGKTTITIGLLHALRRQGLRSAPFKTGPDFIDTILHKRASGKDSINLDLFMSDESHVRSLVEKYSAGSDVCVVEGVMGLLDGFDRQKGSAAHISRLTGFPIVIVIDAASSGYSLAPVLWGIKNFDGSLKIAGVIFNNVASERHLALLRQAAEDAGVPLLGRIMRNRNLELPSRHLGLSVDDSEMIDKFIERAADAVEEGIDIKALLNATSVSECEISSIHEIADEPKSENRVRSKSRIAVAKDDAFNFIYPENLLSLRRSLNGDIVEFSPLNDEKMPEADFLYLPGGYPELYADQLESNRSMRESIREFIEKDGKVFAECGGMLYLCERIDGREMCGVLPAEASMRDARLHLGYRTIEYRGETLKGHEFHYSELIEDKDRIKGFLTDAVQYNLRGEKVDTAVYRYKNAIMGYTHLYFGDKDISNILF